MGCCTMERRAATRSAAPVRPCRCPRSGHGSAHVVGNAMRAGRDRGWLARAQAATPWSRPADWRFDYWPHSSHPLSDTCHFVSMIRHSTSICAECWPDYIVTSQIWLGMHAVRLSTTAHAQMPPCMPLGLSAHAEPDIAVAMRRHRAVGLQREVLRGPLHLPGHGQACNMRM